MKQANHGMQQQSNVLWVENDPRSVHAMLHGKGDGREKLYRAFASSARRKNPNISEEGLTEKYADYVQQNMAKHPGAFRSVWGNFSTMVHLPRSAAPLVLAVITSVGVLKWLAPIF